MRKEDYNTICEENLKEDERMLGLGRRWWFQHDRDPKHKANVVRQKSTFWNGPRSHQTLMPSKTGEVRVNATRPKNINERETICKEECSQIPSEICLNLIKNYKRLSDAIKQKGSTTDYYF